MKEIGLSYTESEGNYTQQNRYTNDSISKV